MLRDCFILLFLLYHCFLHSGLTNGPDLLRVLRDILGHVFMLKYRPFVHTIIRWIAAHCYGVISQPSRLALPAFPFRTSAVCLSRPFYLQRPPLACPRRGIGVPRQHKRHDFELLAGQGRSVSFLPGAARFGCCRGNLKDGLLEFALFAYTGGFIRSSVFIALSYFPEQCFDHACCYTEAGHGSAVKRVDLYTITRSQVV